MLSFLPYFLKINSEKLIKLWICGIPASKSVLDLCTARGPGSRNNMIHPSFCHPTLSTHKACPLIDLYQPHQLCDGSCNLQMVSEKESLIEGVGRGDHWTQKASHHCGKETVFLFFKLSTLNQVVNTGGGWG